MSQSVGSLGGSNAGWIDGHTLPTGGSRDIYFVDTGVANHQTLVASLPTDAQVIHIGRDENGVARIAEALAGQTNISGIHILSHGDDGTVHLGNTSLRSDNLGTYASLLQSWANALGVDADILFYGCNLAGSSAGKAFVDEIARLTGADVAASDNLTGHSLLGGDWYLEYHTGAIETSTLQVVDYQDTLFIANLLFGGMPFDWSPTGVGTQTFANVDGSGVDVEITVTAAGGATPATIDDTGMFTGGVGVTPLIASFLPPQDSMANTNAGLDIMVSFFVTGMMSPIVVNASNFVLTNVDANYTVPLSDPLQQFQDDVMVTGPVAPSIVADGGLTVQTMGSTTRVFAGEDTASPTTDAMAIGTESPGANATVSFSSPVNVFTIEFRDGPVPADQSHGVGFLAGFMLDAPEVRLIGTPGSQVEGNSGTMLYVYTLGLTDSMGVGLTSSLPTTVTYGVAGVGMNPATSGTDFTATTIAVIPGGQTTGLFTVTVNGDTTPEFDETFEVMLTGSVFMLGGTTIAIGTILNDDSPTIGFLNTTFTAAEGNVGTMGLLFTITLSESAPFPVTVSFTTMDGTANSMSDYATMMGNAVFTAGQTAFVVTVPVSGDTLLEPDETFTVMLSNAMAPGVTPSIVASLATGSIINDDTNPGVTLLGPTTFNEGDGTNNQIYTLSLSATNATPTTVTFALANGTADNTDYTPFTQTIAIPAGQSTFTVPVTILGNGVPEADETFSVSIMAVEVFGMSILTSTIRNDDMLSVSILGGAAIMEQQSATTTPFSFTISLNQTAGVPVTVSYLTNNVSATAGSDYMDNDNTVVFAPGQSLATVVVTGIDDAIAEPDETFTVNLISVMP